ncbi:MAG: hypothetical protein WCG42_06715 [Parachlamydiaceae bacterium]
MIPNILFYMNENTEEKLLILNKIGLIPGPGESKEAFLERAEYCLHSTNHLPEEISSDISSDFFHPEVLDSPINDVSELYDIAPAWIPVIYSNHQLPLWHGGCAWIYQLKENDPTTSLIQLRRQFKDSSRYLGIYDRKELLAHELCHVGRMMFQEPKFEEVLAYRTSSFSFRRFFGPLVQSSVESLIFLLMIFIILVFDIFLVATNRPEAYTLALWLKLIPAALIAATLVRLWKRQRTFQKCVDCLTDAVGQKNAYPVAYRLTDAEIDLFSKITVEEVKEYATTYAVQELRWSVIQEAYF